MTRIAIILIGRNEGARFITSLQSLSASTVQPDRVIYVDSGSTDGSLEAAAKAGAEVIALDTSVPFTAARARNAGIEALKTGTAPDLVQFIDGDCALDAGWIATARDFLASRPKVAVVCGRRRERFPEASVYNRLCDAEWDTPIGEAKACGGDALMRWSALIDVGGYNPALIAGEEPEMCLRMRRQGWQIWRIDAEMTLHDADMHRFGQFWARAKRGGHARAEGMAMYGRDPERHGVDAVRRNLIWAVALPVATLLALPVLGRWGLLLLLAYPAQIARLARRAGGARFAWEQAFFLTVGKFAETAGILSYHRKRARGETLTLIEYK